MSKPVIKWVGGKRQLMSKIKELIPSNYNRYFEPFIGGGAVFFELKEKDAFINDYNNELTNLYRVIKENPKELIKDLSKHINSEEYFYKIRSLDRTPALYQNLTNIEKASRFIFLNRTGFNGLYRVNKKREHNVPYGKYPNPKIIDEENILSCSELLQTTTITTGDFENIKEFIEPGDFVYLDPPYVPLTQTSSFTGYTDKGFDESMQVRVRDLCDYITSIGGLFLLSNSHTPIILELYKNYKIITIDANRNLSASTEGRAKVKEVLVKNY